MQSITFLSNSSNQQPHTWSSSERCVSRFCVGAVNSSFFDTDDVIGCTSLFLLYFEASPGFIVRNASYFALAASGLAKGIRLYGSFKSDVLSVRNKKYRFVLQATSTRKFKCSPGRIITLKTKKII